MKNELISSLASWKSAALLALIAMVAAVAFSGVLTNTQKADAALVATPASPVAPGATVTVTSGDIGVGANEWSTWTIATTGAAKATFVSGGDTTLVCQDAPRLGTCDADGNASAVSVEVKIANDSGPGAVVVRAALLTTPQTTDAVVLTVDPGLVPTKITLTPSSKAVSARETTTFPAMNVKVTNSAGDGLEVEVELITTQGSFAAGCTTNDILLCKATTTAAGVIDPAPTLQPVANRPGVATVTAKVVGYPSVTSMAKVTFFGDAKTIEVAPQQGSIQTGGRTFIVVTVKDAAGSPVAGQQFGTTTGTGEGTAVKETAPSEGAKPVDVDVNVDYDANGNRKLDKGDLPACGNDEDATDNADSTNLTTGDDAGTNDGTDVGPGTDADGKCVIEVKAAPPPAAAARGEHTVKVTLNATTSKTVTVAVGGPPDSITHDAPERMDPSEEITVKLTVLDDAGKPVGGVPIQVIQLSRNGLITEPPVTMTVDGRAEFKYLAPSTAGRAEFLVRTRAAVSTSGVFSGATTASQPIIINIGEAPAEETPAATPPALTKPTSVTIALNDDGTLSVTTSPEAAEGDTTDRQVRELVSNGEWVDVSDEAAAPGTYQARARFTRGDDSTDWTYSAATVEVPEPETPEPVAPDAPDTVTLLATADGLVIVTTPDVPEDATEEHQLRAGTGEWTDASEVTVEPSTIYRARARFVRDGAASDWTTSRAVATEAAAPEAPPAMWNHPLATGTHNLVWQGEDGADPADAGDTIVAIWQWTGSGWEGYFAAAGDVGLANTLTELENGEPYWVVVE